MLSLLRAYCMFKGPGALKAGARTLESRLCDEDHVNKHT